MTDEERLDYCRSKRDEIREIFERSGDEYIPSNEDILCDIIDRQEQKISDLREAMIGATRIANVAGSLLNEKDAELARLHQLEATIIPLYKALRYWRDGLIDKVDHKDISAIAGANKAVFDLAAATDVATYPLNDLLKKATHGSL